MCGGVRDVLGGERDVLEVARCEGVGGCCEMYLGSVEGVRDVLEE